MMTQLQPEIEWDHTGFFLLDDKAFPLKVWDTVLSEEWFEGANTVLLRIEAGLDANFDWELEKKRAQAFVSEGLYLIWELDLGLFKHLKLPLYHEGQYQALLLAIKYFTENLWPEFMTSTIGVCLFRGKMDLSWDFRWDAQHLSDFYEWRRERLGIVSEKSFVTLSEIDEKRQEQRLFCRDVCFDLIEAFLAYLPGGVLPFVILDVEGVDRIEDRMQYLLPDRFKHVQVVTNCTNFPMSGMRWRQESGLWQMAEFHEAPIGILLPNYYGFNDYAWEKIVQRMVALKNFRFLSECFFIQQWMGLDRVIVSQKGLNDQSERLLQGFIAAGGEVERI